MIEFTPVDPYVYINQNYVFVYLFVSRGELIFVEIVRGPVRRCGSRHRPWSVSGYSLPSFKEVCNDNPVYTSHNIVPGP